MLVMEVSWVGEVMQVNLSKGGNAGNLGIREVMLVMQVKLGKGESAGDLDKGDKAG